MAVTPEGAIKREVKKVLQEYGEDVQYVPGQNFTSCLKQFWPVQNGMGSPSLDCLVCYYGVFIAIETKAPGKKPTPRQITTMAEYSAAGGVVLVIDGPAGIEALRRALDMIKWSHAGNRQQQA